MSTMSNRLTVTVAALLAAGSLGLSPSASLAEDGPKWGSGEAKTRTPVPGSGYSAYYEPEAVQRDGDVLRLKLYAAVDMADKTTVDEYSINCETREAATLAGRNGGKDEWRAPEKLIAGDKVYALARELCGWGPGFWKRLAD